MDARGALAEWAVRRMAESSRAPARAEVDITARRGGDSPGSPASPRPWRRSRPSVRFPGKPLLAAIVPLLAALLLWVVLPLGAGAAPSEDDLRSRISDSRAREGRLAADAETFGRLARKLARDVAVLQGRLDEVQGELDRRLVQLAGTRASLNRQRRRHAAMLVRLATSREILAQRLDEVYRSDRPDAVSFVLGATDFTDLLDRTEFLRRVNRQDTRIIVRVQVARDDARESAGRLRRLAGRQRERAAVVREQRDAMASMRSALAAKQSSFERARSARLAAARATRSSRGRLQRELDDLLAEQQAAATQTQGPTGSWAIPWAIVQCESGGYNFPPNWAGASGYYQIIPSTWKGFSGSGPAAYLAPKAEQDRVAARIWNGGAGASNWDCAVLLSMV